MLYKYFNDENLDEIPLEINAWDEINDVQVAQPTYLVPDPVQNS